MLKRILCDYFMYAPRSPLETVREIFFTKPISFEFPRSGTMAEGLELLRKNGSKFWSAVGSCLRYPFFDNRHAEELSQVWLLRGLPLDQQVHMCMSRAAQVF